MKYPKFIKENDTIGIIAPSAGAYDIKKKKGVEIMKLTSEQIIKMLEGYKEEMISNEKYLSSKYDLSTNNIYSRRNEEIRESMSRLQSELWKVLAEESK